MSYEVNVIGNKRKAYIEVNPDPSEALCEAMVYATVYQLMTEPDKYVGKTFRIDELYYAVKDEKVGTYYHYCIIKDAQACCSQGLEFVWGDGTHVYPDEYPKDETEIEVTGTFETYKESKDDMLYGHLVNSKLQIK